MSNEEAIRIITEDALYNPAVAAKCIEVLARADEREKAGGCVGCAYYERDEWDMPCAKCRRNCVDYWRRPQ